MNDIAGRHSTALVRRVTLLTAAAILLAALLVAGVSPKGVSATGTVTVDSAGDTNARDGVITGREAILLVTGALSVGVLDAGEADNVVGTPGAASADTIVSAIPGGGSVLLTAPLPALSTGNDTLDGGGPGTIIDGQTTAFTCLQITSNGNVIKGGTIRRCSVGVEISSGATGNTLGGTTTAERGVIIDNTTGLRITGAGTSGNSATGSYVGLASDGATAAPNGTGVRIDGGATGNTIGGTTAAERNVISGNTGSGVTITGSGTTGNTVRGNYIGTNSTGMAAVGNGGGVLIDGGTDGNTVGGATTPGSCTEDCNVISGNIGEGILIADNGTTGNVVSGNFVGIDAAGTSADLGNSGSGVYILRAQSNTIGGTSGGLLNVISGNHGFAGVTICGNPTFCGGEGSPGPGDAGANVVQGNFIGTNPAGTAAIANSNRGVAVDGAPNVVIGGAGSGRNIISGNGTHGIILFNATTGAIVRSNYIGTNKAGTGAISNLSNGVTISVGAYGNTIGGTTAGDGNLISGNSTKGVLMSDAGTTGNVVQGNYIGTNAAGTAAVGNGSDGVNITLAAAGNTIGGATAGARNVISGNTGDGVEINGASSNGNVVKGNYIGTDATGAGDVGNSGSAVRICGGNSNEIGGTAAGAGNVISGNNNGIATDAACGTPTGNLIRGNYIGVNAAGTGGLGNDNYGVLLGGDSGTVIGGASAGARNVISGNINSGILATASSSGAIIRGNYIGTNAAATGSIPNSQHGIDIQFGASSVTIGGVATGEGNTIAYNAFVGVRVASGTGHDVRGNSIYSNGRLGIDLVGGVEDPNGVTANDAGDADTGPNNLMNFPVITSATFDGTNTTVSGTLDTGSPATALVDVYATDVADSSGNGEGRRFLGTAIPGGGGAWSLVISGLPPYTVLAATATDSGGSTSELSAAYTMVLTPGPGLPLTLIARQGQATSTPMGGTFSAFGPAQVPSTTGDVAFWAAVSGASANQAIFKNSGGTITKLVAADPGATGDPTPIGGTFSGLGTVPVMNDSGDVAFFATVSGGSAAQGIFKWSGGTVTKLAATGEATPAGGTYASFAPPVPPAVPVINSWGDVTFWASLSTGGQGLFRHSGSVTRVAATGDPTPVGGTFSSFLMGPGRSTIPTITDNQQVSFRGVVSGGSATEGIFLADYGGTITKVVASGEATPLGGAYTFFTQVPSPNESGQVTFWAGLSGSSASVCTNQGVPCGVFRRESNGVITKIIAGGDAGAPGIGGAVSGIGTVPLMNDSGQISVWTGISNGFATQSLVRYTNGNLVNVAAVGNPTPITPTGGTFSDFIDATLFPTNPIPNNRGQVGLWGKVSDGSGTDGIFITQASASQVVVVPGPVAGAAAPGTNGGTFGDAFDLDISAQGEAVFANTVNNGTADSGIFRYLFFAGEPVQDVALQGQPAPGTAGGTFNNFYFPVNNDNGQIVARASTTGGGPAEGLYLFFAGSAERMAATGESAVGGGGTYASFGDPSMNNVGQVAGTSSLSGGDDGLYLFFAGSPLSGVPCQAVGGYQQCKLAAASGAAPGGDTYLFFAGSPAINNSGMVAQRSTLNAGGQEGLYLFFAGSPIAGVPCQVIDGIQQCKLVSTGTSAPGGGTFSSFGNPMINAGGQVVVSASVSGGTSGVFLFFAGSPISGLPCQLVNGIQQCRLAGVGDSVLSSTFTGFSSATANDAAQAVARATIAATATADEGLFLFFAGYPPVKVALEGDPAATGSGTYGGTSFVFPYFAMNNGAQVVFVAKVSGGSTAQGVFFASLDMDGDGVMDFLDNCPTRLNTDQNNTDKALRAAGWNVVADELGNACDTDADGDGALDAAELITCSIVPDCDSDGFFDGIEDHVGTDPNDRCADTTTPYDERGPSYGEPLSPRPVDINDDRTANLTDILAYIPVFNQSVSPGNVRYDIKQDSSNKIALADILAFIPYFGQTCTP